MCLSQGINPTAQTTMLLRNQIVVNINRTKYSATLKDIRITFQCNIYPLIPHFYIVKLGYIIPIFLIFAPKHKLWVLVRTASPINFFLLKIFNFYNLGKICISHGHVSIMTIT